MNNDLNTGQAYLQSAIWYVANKPVNQMLEWFYSKSDMTVARRREFGDNHLREMKAVFSTRDLTKIWGRMDAANQERFLAECARIYLADALERIERSRR
jgi:hypothetical protein